MSLSDFMMLVVVLWGLFVLGAIIYYGFFKDGKGK